jgi:hypothetical protein
LKKHSQTLKKCGMEMWWSMGETTNGLYHGMPHRKKGFFVPPCAICRLFRFAVCMHVQDLTAKYWLHRSFAQPPCKSLQVSYCLVLDK